MGDDQTWANETLLPRIRDEITGSHRRTGEAVELDATDAHLGSIIINVRNAVAHSRRSNAGGEAEGFFVYPQQSWPHGVRGFSFHSVLNGPRGTTLWSVNLNLVDLKALVYLYVKELYVQLSPFIASLDVRHLR